MHRTIHVALGGAALTLGALVALPGVALAQEIDCTDAAVAAKYPEKCVPVPGGTIDGNNGGPATGEVTPTLAPSVGKPVTATTGTTTGAATGGASSLPFTGDEVLVLSIAGAGALAAGTALAAAGRRRRTPSA